MTNGEAEVIIPFRQGYTDTVAVRKLSLEQLQARVDMCPPAIMITAPHPSAPPQRDYSGYGASAVVLLLILMFCAVGLRFRNNVKYVGAIVSDLIEVRERHNAFDDTVRETSFLVMLNILWSLSAGVIIYCAIKAMLPVSPVNSIALKGNPALFMMICMGVAVAYSAFMALAYLLVGNVFADRRHAEMWVKGFAASQGLLSLFFFPLALLCLCYPQYIVTLLWVALGAFTLAKIIFIWKGFRIFFTRISSWVLFLYYLCSLEIIPLFITFFAALQLCLLAAN